MQSYLTTSSDPLDPFADPLPRSADAGELDQFDPFADDSPRGVVATVALDPGDPFASIPSTSSVWFDEERGEWVGLAAEAQPGCMPNQRHLEPSRAEDPLRAEFERRRRSMPEARQDDWTALAALHRRVYDEEAGDALQIEYERQGSQILNRSYARDDVLSRKALHRVFVAACRPRPRSSRRAPRPIRRRRAAARAPASGTQTQNPRLAT
jgi:hypothetical protein